MSTLAARIQQARMAQGLSQSALARQLGVKPQSVQRWESGAAGPQRKRLAALAAALSVSAAWLATGGGPMQTGKSGADLLRERQLPDDLIDLATLLRELPAEKVQAALVLLGIDGPARRQPK